MQPSGLTSAGRRLPHVAHGAPLIVLLTLTLAGCAGTSRTVREPAQAATPSQARAESPRPADPVDPAGGVYHEVQAGQTLWRIATAYDVSVDELVRRNDLADPDLLPEGFALFIPGATKLLDVPAAPRVNRGDWTWPVSGGRVVSRYGVPRSTHRHQGIDIDGRFGQDVLAVRGGRVVYSGSSMRGYGKTIIVDHGDGLQSLYAHNTKLLVVRGQRVERGQPVARLGRSGNATGDHCHLEIRRGDVAVDPLLYLSPDEVTRR